MPKQNPRQRLRQREGFLAENLLQRYFEDRGILAVSFARRHLDEAGERTDPLWRNRAKALAKRLIGMKGLVGSAIERYLEWESLEPPTTKEEKIVRAGHVARQRVLRHRRTQGDITRNGVPPEPLGYGRWSCGVMRGWTAHSLSDRAMGGLTLSVAVALLLVLPLGSVSASPPSWAARPGESGNPGVSSTGGSVSHASDVNSHHQFSTAVSRSQTPSDGWSRLTTDGSPPPQWGTSLAFDPAVGGMVEFGGADFSVPFYQNSTWILINDSWHNETHGTAPSARLAAQLTYDYADGYLLLFGGCGVVQKSVANCPPNLGDTWEYSDNNWTQIHSSISPSPRQQAGLTFDAADGYVLLFGGNNGTSPLGDTWVYKGGEWTELHPNPSPPAESGGSLVFDPSTGYCILFGGTGANPTGPGAVYNTTWAFKGGQWFNLTTSVSPSPRDFSRVIYDPTTGYDVLFGGENAQNLVLNDTWAYRGGTWANLTGPFPGPQPRVGFGMDYDPGLNGLVVFGGLGGGGSPLLNDTWTFRAPGTPSYQVHIGVSPAHCGPVDWTAVPELNGATIVAAVGNYTVVAPSCPGYAFDRWNLSGGLAVSNSTDPVATIAVAGIGTIEVVYTLVFPIHFDAIPSSCGELVVDGKVILPNQTVNLTNGTHPILAPICSGTTFASWVLSGMVIVESAGNASTTMVVNGAGSVTATYRSPSSSSSSIWTSTTLWFTVGLLAGLVVGVVINVVLRRRRPPDTLTRDPSDNTDLTPSGSLGSLSLDPGSGLRPPAK